MNVCYFLRYSRIKILPLSYYNTKCILNTSNVLLLSSEYGLVHPSKFGTGNGTSIVTPKKYSQFWDFFTLGRHSTVLRFSFCGKNSSTIFYRQPYPPNTLKHLSRPKSFSDNACCVVLMTCRIRFLGTPMI